MLVSGRAANPGSGEGGAEERPTLGLGREQQDQEGSGDPSSWVEVEATLTGRLSRNGSHASRI